MGYLSGIKAFLSPPSLEQAETTENKEISEVEKEIVELEQQIEILNNCWVKLKLKPN